MAIKKWEKVGEPRVLAGKFGKSLISQPFIDPNTSRLEEFTLFKQRDWSVVLAVTDDGQVLVVTEFKQGRDSVGDELPAGTANFDGEEPEEVAARELEEETGYRPKSMIPLGHGWIATRSSPTKFHAFLATGCIKVGEGKLDANEYIEARLVPLDEWIAMAASGQITEPSAIVTTMRALNFLDYKIARKQ